MILNPRADQMQHSALEESQTTATDVISHPRHGQVHFSQTVENWLQCDFALSAWSNATVDSDATNM